MYLGISELTISAWRIVSKLVPKINFISLATGTTIASAILITPFAIFSVFFWDLPWWYIIIGLVATIFLIKNLRNYQCNYVRNLAKKDESIYKILVEKGAFLF